MGLEEEILEQPRAMKDLVARGRGIAESVAAKLARRPRFVYIIARGSSDNAGLFAKYLFGIENRLPVAMALPSLFTRYHTPPVLKDALVVGISQSGRSPDLVQSMEEARRQGAPTLAVTNVADSPLAATAEHVFDLGVGPEVAVAATKTYTAELVALLQISAALGTGDWEVVDAIPRLAEEALAEPGRHAANRLAFEMKDMGQCVVLGRGYNYATAYEWSLKLKELAYVVAEPYSSADFRHGPIAIVDEGFPVLVTAPSGAVSDDVVELARRLGRERKARIVMVSNRNDVGDLDPLVIPGAPEKLSPLLGILPAQWFTLALTRAKGLDPEHPRGLRKITSTR